MDILWCVCDQLSDLRLVTRQCQVLEDLCVTSAPWLIPPTPSISFLIDWQRQLHTDVFIYDLMHNVYVQYVHKKCPIFTLFEIKSNEDKVHRRLRVDSLMPQIFHCQPLDTLVGEVCCQMVNSCKSIPSKGWLWGCVIAKSIFTNLAKRKSVKPWPLVIIGDEAAANEHGLGPDHLGKVTGETRHLNWASGAEGLEVGWRPILHLIVPGHDLLF